MTGTPPGDPGKLALHSLIASWAPELRLSGRRLREVRRAVVRAGTAIGVLDEAAAQPFHPNTLVYQTRVIAEAFDAQARRQLGGYPRRGRALAPQPLNQPPPLEAVQPSRLVAVLDVNAVEAGELAALPGFGPVSSRRVVARRKALGPYTDLQSVRRAGRISTTAFARAEPFIRIGDGSRSEPFTRVHRSVLTGGLAALVDEVARGNVELPGVAPGSREAALLALLPWLADQIMTQPYRPRFWAPQRARLERGQRAIRWAQGFDDAAARDDVRVALIRSSGYLPMLLRLIAAATERVWAAMFFFHVAEGAREGPTDQIVKALSEAVQRGVDVRLLLADDLPDDYHRAHAVNAGAVDALRAAGVPFRLSYPDQPAHAKCVVVDDRHVLIGSHNWTTSSFFRYEETSCYALSAALAAQTAHRLQARWGMLADTADERVIALSESEFLTPERIQLLADDGILDGETFRSRTATAAARRAMAARVGLAPDHVALLREAVELMRVFRVSETTGFALAAAGLRTPTQVRRASLVRLQGALTDLSALPEPFAVRSVPSGVATYLREAADV